MGKSNYDAMRDAMEPEFLKYDQDRMINRFGLTHDREYLYIRFVGMKYRVNRFSGKVEACLRAEEGYVHADYNVSMTIFDVLCCARSGCCLSGRYVPVNSVKNVVQSASLGSGLFEKEGKFFTNKRELLREACEKLGGVPWGNGDVSYEIPLFDFLPVVLQFWDADDEFDAVLKVMWDENILTYMHYETTYFAAAHLLSRLMTLCGQKGDGVWTL